MPQARVLIGNAIPIMKGETYLKRADGGVYRHTAEEDGIYVSPDFFIPRDFAAQLIMDIDSCNRLTRKQQRDAIRRENKRKEREEKETISIQEMNRSLKLVANG